MGFFETRGLNLNMGLMATSVEITVVCIYRGRIAIENTVCLALARI
jgi:hypothetical protein